MRDLREERPKDLSHYVALVERLQGRAGQPLWFRGCGRPTDRLVPSLYRHPLKRKPPQLQELERQLMTRFRQRSIPYRGRDLDDDWEALFFMQHHGVPTRLLDWTENPLTGLHFALMGAPYRVDKRTGKLKFSGSAVVWVLNPVTWNTKALEHLSYTGGPLTQGDEALKGYAPQTNVATMSIYPVALYGAHNSARIVAQQGVFAIFGRNRTPMETLVRRGEFPRDALIRVVYPASRIKAVRQSILDQGVTESALFPDLDGLARETKRYFGFEA